MKSRIVRFGVLIASVMGLLATSTAAEASWVKHVALNGAAALTGCTDATTGAPSPGLSDPVWTSGLTTTVEVPDVKTETKTGPKGVPEVNTIVLNGNLCDFVLTADCIKESGGPKKTGLDICNFRAIGTVTGFCRLASGLGTAVLENLGPVTGGPPNKETVVTDFKFSLTGKNLRVADKDGDDTDWIKGVGLMEASGAPGAGSCTNKTATTFIVTANLVIKNCTPGSSIPGVCP